MVMKKCNLPSHRDSSLMLRLFYHPDLDMVTMRAIPHIRPCVTFSDSAAEFCGGAIEYDEDGYITRCAHEVEFVNTAREILHALHTEEDANG
jgi:hypothetical protein